jgi:tryptophanyl-tRNA synthetase
LRRFFSRDLEKGETAMMAGNRKYTMVSGIQPSGELMIGNYFGAIRNWVVLQDGYDCFLPVVDLHALTVRQDPETLRRRALDYVALYIACGIDPRRATIFIQSHVPAHAELAWILSCFAHMGELSRMTQFKDKARRHAANVNAGLFAYPVLMAADVLVYGADLVPVGEDQRQHLELARSVARRFNGIFGEVLKAPAIYIPAVGARIMSLQRPAAKMSKSDEDADGSIFLLDGRETIRRKVMKAVTDSGHAIALRADRPAMANLLTIYACATGAAAEEVENLFAKADYGRFKQDLAEALIALLEPIQKRFHEVRQAEERLAATLSDGAYAASRRAAQVLRAVQDAVGLVPKASRPASSEAARRRVQKVG